MLTILFAIIAGLALIMAGYLLHLLLVERGVTDQLSTERDEVILEKNKLLGEKKHNQQTVVSLREELSAARQHNLQVERFSTKRIEEMSAALRGAHALIEMFLEQFEGLEDGIHLDRKEARRLFVV